MAATQRATWWIVSTHVLTTGFAMPLVATFAGMGIVIGTHLDGFPALLAILASQAIGYIGGTYYSLSYLAKSATTEDWTRCTKPSAITFVILCAIGLVLSVIQYRESPMLIALILAFYAAIVPAFIKITADGFRSLQARAQPVVADPEYCKVEIDESHEGA